MSIPINLITNRILYTDSHPCFLKLHKYINLYAYPVYMNLGRRSCKFDIAIISSLLNAKPFYLDRIPMVRTMTDLSKSQL